MRHKAERRASPSAAIIGGQSIKIGSLTNKSCGKGGCKRRKRRVLLDTLGLIILAVITVNNVSNKAGAKTLFI